MIPVDQLINIFRRPLSVSNGLTQGCWRRSSREVYIVFVGSTPGFLAKRTAALNWKVESWSKCFRRTRQHLTVSQHQIHLTRGLAGCLKLACKRMRHQDWSRIRASSWWWGFDSPKWDLWGSKLLNEAIGQRGWSYKPFSRAHRDDFGNEHPFGFVKQYTQ